MEDTVQEKIYAHITLGQKIRSSGLAPLYAQGNGSPGNIHRNLHLMYDPAYYMERLFEKLADHPDNPRVDTELLRSAILGYNPLNLATGIMERAYVERDGEPAWYDVDWEIVPAETEAFEAAFKSYRNDQLLDCYDTLVQAANIQHRTFSLTMNYLAILAQNGTFVLPDISVVFQGDAGSSIPMISGLVAMLNLYLESHDNENINAEIRKWFGVNAYLEGKQPYLTHNRNVPLTDLITNQALLALENSPDDPLDALATALGPSILLIYARAASTGDARSVILAAQCMDKYESITQYQYEEVLQDESPY